MPTNREKQVLKQFLDGFETEELCKIVRSLHRGKVIADNREDSEMLLLAQPFVRVLSNNKVKAISILKFLILKGVQPPINATKVELCLGFQLIIDNQSSIINNTQLMDTHLIPSSSQAVAQEIPNPPLREEYFMKQFAKEFYDLLNDLGIPGKNQLNSRYCYENCSMSLKLVDDSTEINDISEDLTTTLQCLLSIKNEYLLFFSPYLQGIKWQSESHGLIKVNIGGTLHQDVGRTVGVFEQQFILREDPLEENTWKILNIHFTMKNMNIQRLSNNQLTN